MGGRKLLSLARRAHGPGLPLIPHDMAWRPYQNLIDGELDNRTAGKVTGWMRFYRRGKDPFRVTFDLTGDFHEDIRGKVIRLSNPLASEENPNSPGTVWKGSPHDRSVLSAISLRAFRLEHGLRNS